jgi:quinol-cytochrome oxidoreductase complex cytochrome b subunit
MGSSNVIKSKVTTCFTIRFFPFLIIKDILSACIFIILLLFIVYFQPELLNHCINYIEANILVTPDHIVPE